MVPDRCLHRHRRRADRRVNGNRRQPRRRQRLLDSVRRKRIDEGGRIADEQQRRDGVHMALAKTRRIPSESLDQRIKNFHWLDLTMSLFEAYDRGATISVLPDADGNITEGPGFNVFVVKEGVLATPDHGMFEGIPRRTVIEIAADLQLRCEVRRVHADEILAADEIFMSTTAGGITPVTRFDGRLLGDGRPGTITTRIHDIYWQRHDDDTLSTPIDYAG